MYELSGRQHSNLSEQMLISKMDEDYQMIDAHIDKTLRRKIQDFEFIDLARLLPRNRGITAEDEQHQRLEIVTKNGTSFLLPAPDHDNLTINSYGRWEQAF